MKKLSAILVVLMILVGAVSCGKDHVTAILDEYEAIVVKLEKGVADKDIEALTAAQTEYAAFEQKIANDEAFQTAEPTEEVLARVSDLDSRYQKAVLASLEILYSGF